MTAADVSANGVNTELTKTIFHNFVRLAAKVKSKNNKAFKKTQIIKNYSIVEEFAIKKIC